MSHESVIAALNRLSKKRVFDTKPAEHAQHVIRETPRSSLILHGSMIEHMLEAQLEVKLSGLNSTERGKIFSPEGPLGTFANKVRMAKGLKIMDQATAKQIDVIRALRNAAAHSIEPMAFSDPPIKNAITQMATDKAKAKVAKLNVAELRYYFELTCMNISTLLNSGKHQNSDAERLQLVEKLSRQIALRGKTTV